MNSKEYFEQVAGQWDEMRQSFFSENVREAAYAIANPEAGQVAADIGAGTGFMTDGLLRKGLTVIAVDRSEAMVETMKRKFPDSDRIDYRVGESERLPVEDGTVDYVFANMYLHHVETPSEAIREMARILRPGGKVVITDLDEHDFDFLKTEHHDRWMGFRREAIRQWFDQAGLTHVKVDCAGESCSAVSTCGSGNATIGIFIAYGEK